MPGKLFVIVVAAAVFLGACSTGGGSTPTTALPSDSTTSASVETTSPDGWTTTSLASSSTPVFGSLPEVTDLPGQVWEFVWGTPGAMQWSPNGELLAFASSVAVYLYRYDDFPAEPKTLRIDPLTVPPHEVAFSPDASRVAVAVGDGIRVWDTTSGDEVSSVALPGASNVVFVDDTTIVALGASHIVAYDIETATVAWDGEFVSVPQVLTGRLTIDLDTGQVLYGTGSATVLREAATGEVLLEVPSAEPVVAVAFSEAGIITTDGARIYLLDRDTGEELDESLMPFGASRVQLAVDGNSVFIDNRGAVGRWQPSATGDSPLSEAVFGETFVGFHLIGDGTGVTSFGPFAGVSVVSTDDLTVVGGPFDDVVSTVEGLAVSATGRVAVATPAEVVVFDLAEPDVTVTNRGGPLRAFRVDDATIAAGAAAVGWTSLAGNRAILWDPRTNELIDSVGLDPANRTYGIVLDGIAGLAYFDDGVSFATLAYDGPDGAAGEAREALAGSGADGYLVTNDSACLIVRDASSFEEIGAIGTGFNVWRLAVSGGLVVTEGFGDFDGIRAFDLSGDLGSREDCRRSEDPPIWQIVSEGLLLGVWPDGVFVLDGANLVQVDPASGSIIAESALDFGDDRVLAAAFDPGSRRVAVHTRGAVSLYAADTGELLTEYFRGGTPTFDSTGRYLMIRGDNLWVVDLDSN